MALNPIVYTEKVVRSFPRYQLTAYPFAGNRLHALHGDRSGQHAICVHDQWRICFRFIDGDAYDVEFCDYH